MKYSTIVLLLLLTVSAPAAGQAKKINDYHWSGVERVVVIGDLHGDYDQPDKDETKPAITSLGTCQ